MNLHPLSLGVWAYRGREKEREQINECERTKHEKEKKNGEKSKCMETEWKRKCKAVRRRVRPAFVDDVENLDEDQLAALEQRVLARRCQGNFTEDRAAEAEGDAKDEPTPTGSAAGGGGDGPGDGDDDSNDGPPGDSRDREPEEESEPDNLKLEMREALRCAPHD